MGAVISFTNQKGGVGKTTSAVNVAACLAKRGKKVLLVDMDPQGNTTSGVGIGKKQVKNSVYDALIGAVAAEQTVITTKFKNLSVIPSTISLAGAEFELQTLDNREACAKAMLASVKDQYDYVIIDCPPTLGLLTINALVASDGMIIPMQCEYYALEGLSQLMISVKKIKKLYNPSLQLTGILLTMYNGRLILTTQVVAELKKYYADKLFKVPITRSVKLSEAPGFGEPICYYEPSGKSALQYMAIAKELALRI